MMPRFHIARWILPSALACAFLLAGVLSSSASAATSTYGELLRFNGIGTGTHKGKKFELEEETHAFGVDPVDNSIYVGDENAGEEAYRIQKYNEKGEFLASKLLKPGGAKIPPGLLYVEDLDGVAIDHVNGVIYVLVTYKRNNTDKIDFGKEVAGAVYAFSTTPKGEELVPAPNANQETGLLASDTTLLATSETQGQALLETVRHRGGPTHARSDDPRTGR